MLYHIFISHAWRYSDDFNRLKSLLDNAPDFSYCDYSISKEKSLSDTLIPDDTIKQQLRRQIGHAGVVLVLLGMYGAYRQWIQTEMGLAKSFTPMKPIIGIRPWSQQRIPKDIEDVCNDIVGWNTNSIVENIKSNYHC